MNDHNLLLIDSEISVRAIYASRSRAAPWRCRFAILVPKSIVAQESEGMQTYLDVFMPQTVVPVRSTDVKWTAGEDEGDWRRFVVEFEFVTEDGLDPYGQWEELGLAPKLVSYKLTGFFTVENRIDLELAVYDGQVLCEADLHVILDEAIAQGTAIQSEVFGSTSGYKAFRVFEAGGAEVEWESGSPLPESAPISIRSKFVPDTLEVNA